MMRFNLHDWFWIVGGDESRAWSSAAGTYVSEYPADRLTRIASEEDLSDVLRPYGLSGPHVSPADVKAEAQRRIIVLTGAADLQSCLIKQLNASMRAIELNDKRVSVSGGVLTPEEEAESAALRGFAAAIDAIRARSNELETLDPIPAGFAADEFWE